MISLPAFPVATERSGVARRFPRDSVMRSIEGRVLMDGKFIGRLILYLGIFLLLAQAPLSLLQKFKILTASAVTSFWRLFFPAASSGEFIDFMGFPMVVTLECTAIHYMTIYTAGVLAYSSHSLRYRLLGLAAGLPVIFALNVLRIGIVGYVGYAWAGYFEFVHEYLWQGSFALIVFLLWMLWIREAGGRSGAFTDRFLPALGAALLATLVLATGMDHYAVVLASVSNLIFDVLPFGGSPQLMAVAEGSYVGYVLPDGVIYNAVSQDVLGTAIFYAIVAGWSRKTGRKVLLRRLAMGTILLFVHHGAYTVFYGILLSRNVSSDIFSVILYSAKGASLAAPLIVWFLVKRMVPDRGIPSIASGCEKNREGI